MKSVIFTLLVIMAAFTSCKKDALPPEEIQPETNKAAFATSWEPVNSISWQSSTTDDGEQLYTFNRSTPQVNSGVLSNGAVIVYARGYSFGELPGTKPMSMPFMIYTENEQQSMPFSWDFAPAPGNLSVSLKMAKQLVPLFVQGQNGIELQYFVLPPEFLLKHNLTRFSAAKMSYQQLSDLIAQVK